METVHDSPYAAHGTLLGTLHTDLANTSTLCGIVGRINALLHHSLGGLADVEQRGGIATLVLTVGHEVDDTLTIIYGLVNGAWIDCIMAFHGELTATPSTRKRFIIIRALASRTPVLGFGHGGYISKGIEATESVQVGSEISTIATWKVTGGNGEVFLGR